MAVRGESQRFLVCEPRGFGVHHLLNPWMEWSESVDVALAVRQWESLCDALRDAGADVHVMPNHSRSGAMTFTRDTAVVTATGEALVLRNHGRRGDLEPEVVADWLRADGFDISTTEQRIDGGNVVPTADGWVIGIAPGSDREQSSKFAVELHERTGAIAFGVPIRDPRYGHLDTAFADLAGRGWLVHPAAFAQPDLTADAWRRIIQHRPTVEATAAEAEALACNVVVVNGRVIGGLTPRLCREIEVLGLDPVPVDLGEFRKAGGGAHCLTLELDPVHTRPPAVLTEPQRAAPDQRRPLCHVP